jgi:hypothetical protein
VVKEKVSEQIQWCHEHAFVKELDKSFKAWKIGKAKAFTLSEIDTIIEQLRQNKKTNTIFAT